MRYACIVECLTECGAGGRRARNAFDAMCLPAEGESIRATMDDKIRAMDSDVAQGNATSVPGTGLDDGALGEVAGGGVIAGDDIDGYARCLDCKAIYPRPSTDSGNACKACPVCGSTSYAYL